MLFNSHVFILIFLPTAMGGYFALNGAETAKWRVIWLVACSLFFYSWWNVAYLPLFFGSIVINYILGRVIGGSSPASRRGLLIAGVTFNLGLLGYYKYTGFGVDIINSLTAAGVPRPEITLPLGISFFTFQQIAFLVDAARGHGDVKSFWSYALFVSFFPQLIAGPIVHHKQIIPQLDPRKAFVRSADFALGITIFIIGLAKKVLIADTMADFANPVFNGAARGETFSAAAAWFGALAYTFQLYFDFSGYSDMAIGLGRLFGVRLPLNFDSPYKSDSIIEFWRRWHMTLSQFLRDYLYIPLGGNQRGPTRRYINLTLTMLLGGLWHGANWTFVIWGGLHGLYLCINHGWRALTNRREAPDARPSTISPIMPWISRGVTFMAVVVAWVFFRASNTSVALGLLGSMCGLSHSGRPPSEVISSAGALWICFCCAVVWLAPNAREFTTRFESGVVKERTESKIIQPRWTPHPAWAVVFAGVGLITILALSRASEFIYYQF